MDMTPDRWLNTTAYIRDLFAREDDQLRSLMERATAAGLPDIDIGPEVGRLLQMLVMLTGGNGGVVVEVGTLAGYSTIWLARGIERDPAARLITIELSSTHIDIAAREIAAAGLASRVTIRQGRGAEVLPKLLAELGPGSCNLILFDAARAEYPAMLETAHALLRPRGILAVDNALNAGRWVADPIDPAAASAPPDPMDVFNRLLAADQRFVSVVVPMGNGVAVGVKR